MTDFLTLQIKKPDESLFSRSKASLASAEEFEIRTLENAEDAGAVLREIKGLSKELEEKRTSITKPINQALREINALFKPAKGWLQQAESLLKSKILDFQNEQDRIAREAQAKADAAAMEERKRLERKAKIVETIGRTERADEIREEADAHIAPVVKSAAPKMEGVVRRETWKAEVTDKAAFLKYVIEERQDLMALVNIDNSALNAQARSLKENLSLPGVRVYKESSIAAGST